MHDTGCSGLVHWDDPEGWDGEGGGRGVQNVEHMTQRDGMGREVGGGFRIGNTWEGVSGWGTHDMHSGQCMAKPMQCCKVKLIN